MKLKDFKMPKLKLKFKKMRINIPEELENAIYVATSFDTISDLIDFEQEQNRSSIGAISDLFYDNIELETFSSENDVLVFYDKHKDVLDTIINNNEVSVLPKFSNTPYRYVANADGIFSVFAAKDAGKASKNTAAHFLRTNSKKDKPSNLLHKIFPEYMPAVIWSILRSIRCLCSHDSHVSYPDIIPDNVLPVKDSVFSPEEYHFLLQ